LLHGYLDGELDAMRAQEFEQHLENCSQCIAQLEEQEKLRGALQAAQLYERAPESLTRKFRRQIARAESDRGWQWPRIWQWAAVSAAMLLVVAMTSLGVQRFLATRAPGQQALLAEVIDAHVRSLQPGHLTDVISTDQHTVKPWFDGKLDYIPPVRDLAESGFPLVGGRLDVLNGRSVAVLVYARRKHLINVFVWPEGKQNAELPTAGSRNGFQWIYSSTHGMEFCAISDVSAADLHSLTELLQE